MRVVPTFCILSSRKSGRIYEFPPVRPTNSSEPITPVSPYTSVCTSVSKPTVTAWPVAPVARSVAARPIAA